MRSTITIPKAIVTPFLCSFKNSATFSAAHAKPWVAPLGTSGMYMTDEVCKSDSKIWRSKQDNNPYEPGATGTESFWEVIA